MGSGHLRKRVPGSYGGTFNLSPLRHSLFLSRGLYDLYPGGESARTAGVKRTLGPVNDGAHQPHVRVDPAHRSKAGERPGKLL